MQSYRQWSSSSPREMLKEPARCKVSAGAKRSAASLFAFRLLARLPIARRASEAHQPAVWLASQALSVLPEELQLERAPTPDLHLPYRKLPTMWRPESPGRECFSWRNHPWVCQSRRIYSDVCWESALSWSHWCTAIVRQGGEVLGPVLGPGSQAEDISSHC